MRAITLNSQNPWSSSGGIDDRSLDSRIQAADTELRSCELCERRCGVNRRAGEPAACRLGADTYCFKRYLSFTEEPELVPALRVYLGGCNFRCRFCNTAPDCYRPRLGERIEPDRLASELRAAIDAGAKTVNLLGGEPSLHVHTILQIATAAPALPLVLNTNAYMTPNSPKPAPSPTHYTCPNPRRATPTPVRPLLAPVRPLLGDRHSSELPILPVKCP